MKAVSVFIISILYSVFGSGQNWIQSGGHLYPLTITDSVSVGLNNPNNLFQVKNLINFDNATGGTYFGQNAGINNTANYNTFFGYEAGKATTSGKQNVFIGYKSGTANTTGKNNVFLGESAGITNTTGYSCTFVGRKAGENNSSGFENSFVGKETGRYNTTGSNNTAVGTQALKGNTTGSYNMALGNNALQYSSAADSNTVIGFSALGGYDHVYRSNVVIGFEAGNNSGDMRGCVLIGNRVGFTNTSDNRLMIDNSSTNTPLIDGDFAANVVTINGSLGLSVGTTVTEFSTDGTMSGNSDDALCTEKAIVTYVNNIVSSSSFWQNSGNYVYQSSLTDSVGVGLNNPNNLFQVKNLINFDNATGGTYFGQNAGINNTANYNTFFGYEAGKATTSGKQNVFIGYKSGTANTTGKNNVFIGESAGITNTTGYSCTFVGRKAGENNLSGFENSFVGKESGRYNTTGSNNTAIGTQALKGNSTGSYNMALGNNALQYSTTADSNAVIGFAALGGLDNVYSQNVVIGFEAGHNSGDMRGCVLIGNRVGYTNSTDNRLMIDNSSTNTPLIDGDFANDVLTINNVLKLTPRSTAPSNPVAGMMYIDSSDGNRLKVYDGSVWHAMW